MIWFGKSFINPFYVQSVFPQDTLEGTRVLIVMSDGCEYVHVFTDDDDLNDFMDALLASVDAIIWGSDLTLGDVNDDDED